MVSSDFKKIKRILRFVWENQHSDFYHKKYQKAGINPLLSVKKPEDFLRLPYVTRQELCSVKPLERIFASFSSFNQLRIDYDCPRSGKPLVIYRLASSNLAAASIALQNIRKFLKKTRTLLIICPDNLIDENYRFLARAHKKICLVGEQYNWDLTARVAAKCRIEAVSAAIPQLLTLGPLFKKYYDPIKIKRLIIRSMEKPPTIYEKNMLSRYYPEAKYLCLHSTSWIIDIGFQCAFLSRKLNAKFHVYDFILPEVIKKNSHELVITHLVTKDFPLIRYKTDWQVKQSGERCPCGLKSLFELT